MIEKMELSLVDMNSKQITYADKSVEKSRAISVQELKKQIEVNPGYQLNLQEKTILNAIEEINKKLQGMDRELERSIHEKTNQMIIKVIDVNTKEVLKEFPPEKIIDMIVAMCEQAGIFVDEKA